MSQEKVLKVNPVFKRFLLFLFLYTNLLSCLLAANQNLNGVEKVLSFSFSVEKHLAKSYPDRVSKKYLQIIADDMVSLLSSPFHWHGQDW
ncbi:MAG: hypothetical protein H5U07_03175, partial [Candidatus Aminicenantes bacterium]|nr:hypothetical protein [Candidatus Aminicenantes bacterium]